MSNAGLINVAGFWTKLLKPVALGARPRSTRPSRVAKRINSVGLKRQYALVPGAHNTFHTTYFANAVKRRRAANRVARASRKRNRS